MAAKMKFNRGDVAEGILGACLAAKFINRPAKATDTYPTVTKKNIDEVLDDFFKTGGELVEEVKDKAVKKKRVKDKVIFSIALPIAALTLLKNKKARKEMFDDLYDSSIAYVEKEWEKDVADFYMNGNPDTIEVRSDGTGDQKGTKADIKMDINGKKYHRQISLKVSGGEQFAQVSGDEFSKQLAIWNDILGLDIKKMEKKYNLAMKGYDKSKFFASRDDKKLIAFKDMLKTASRAVYIEASKQIKSAISSKNTAFYNSLVKLVIDGVTKGELEVELVKLESSKYKRLNFDKKSQAAYVKRMKKLSLKVVVPTGIDPQVRIYDGTESKNNLILQIRVKIEAPSKNTPSGKVYKPYMRNYVEAGPRLFTI